MASNGNSQKRYTLILPEDVYAEVEQIADTKQIPVVEVFRKFIRLGLLAEKIGDDPDSALLIREGDREREIILI